MRKIQLLGITAMIILGLVACGSQDRESNSEPKENPSPAEQKDVSNNKPEKNENGDVIYTKAGQKGKVDGGTLELLKIKDVNETIDIAPMKITVKDIKLFKMTDMTDEIKQSFQMYNDNKAIGDELIYVQISYDGENTEEKNVTWGSLKKAVTDKGQQIDVDMNDMISTDADTDGNFLGKVTKEFTDGFVINNEDISKLKLIWAATYDSDSYEDLTKEQQVEYTF